MSPFLLGSAAAKSAGGLGIERDRAQLEKLGRGTCRTGRIARKLRNAGMAVKRDAARPRSTARLLEGVGAREARFVETSFRTGQSREQAERASPPTAHSPIRAVLRIRLNRRHTHREPIVAFRSVRRSTGSRSNHCVVKALR